MNRIQRLLLSDEYANFDDTVLVESPFAQVTGEGLGVRQVQIGLSPTKLVIASDLIWPISPLDWLPSLDPEINTLELVSIVPVDLLKLRTYRTMERQLLSIELCTGRMMLFEFGGFTHRQFYWDWWRDRIDELRYWQNRPACTEFMSHSDESRARFSLNLGKQVLQSLDHIGSESDHISPRTNDSHVYSNMSSSTALLSPISPNHRSTTSKSSNESWFYQQMKDISQMFSRKTISEKKPSTCS